MKRKVEHFIARVPGASRREACIVVITDLLKSGARVSVTPDGNCRDIDVDALKRKLQRRRKRR